MAIAINRRRPRKLYLARMYAGSTPTRSVNAVLTAACHAVNQMTCPTLPNGEPVRWRTVVHSNVATGQA